MEELDGLVKQENPEEHREVVEAPASSKKALQASVTRIAQESISFGRLLQEAKETLKAGTIPARRLHQQLDALEAKTRQLRADAGASAEAQAQARQAHRQRFDLITRGSAELGEFVASDDRDPCKKFGG
ncbi:unnamed protein product [Durusdinium trenchii]|uniref:Uncharacterized protein n=1 Tax=Durusdinium trenchii TaxID=1381693 RepID=A0ABP0MIB4_9DINO